MAKQSFNEYPYGQFPTKFTKTGQKQYFEELTNTEQKINTLNVAPPEPQQNNSFDISKLLPLIKMMSDKKSMSSTDMLSLFIPLLGGGGNNISELMSLMNSSKSTTEEVEEDISPTDTMRIDEYKRVE